MQTVKPGLDEVFFSTCLIKVNSTDYGNKARYSSDEGETLMKRISMIMVVVTLALLVYAHRQTLPANSQTLQKMGTPRPDLVPFGTSQYYGGPFCVWNAAPESNDFADVVLYVFVKNEWSSESDGSHGGGDAPASTVAVSFKLYSSWSTVWQTFYGPVPPLLAGKRTLSPVVFKVPKKCFSASNYCDFTITVDSGNQVQETHESNNTVSASCRHYVP
jgi:hypothetical protein